VQNASSIIWCRERWPQAYYFTEGSIVIVWRRSHQRQLLSYEPPTTTTMTTRHASRAYLDKWELLVRDKLLGSYKRLQNFRSRKPQKKCKGRRSEHSTRPSTPSTHLHWLESFVYFVFLGIIHQLNCGPQTLSPTQPWLPNPKSLWDFSFYLIIIHLWDAKSFWTLNRVWSQPYLGPDHTHTHTQNLFCACHICDKFPLWMSARYMALLPLFGFICNLCF
jgi:hypothetical protein